MPGGGGGGGIGRGLNRWRGLDREIRYQRLNHYYCIAELVHDQQEHSELSDFAMWTAKIYGFQC